MIAGTEWVLIDTETNGLMRPILPVEIGAQRMRGWAPQGGAFRCLINQNARISAEASRVHGYTPEILERDGLEPEEAYDRFFDYANGLPLVSYSLAFDYDKVLLRDWERLGIEPANPRGFCALRLTQRLLDPSPAGNCKLQTLRQFYRLPERGAHTALGDVETTADLISTVLAPLAEARGIDTWDDLVALTEGIWFPTRLPFGKFKGRDYRDVRTDGALMGWLEWLSRSKRDDYSKMGHWYLGQLEQDDTGGKAPLHVITGDAAHTAIQIFKDPQEEALKQAIAAAKEKLTSVEADYAEARHLVAVFEAELFRRVGIWHRRKEQLRLRVQHLEELLEFLSEGDAENTDKLNKEFKQDNKRLDDEYDAAARVSEGTKALSPEVKREINDLHRKLVRKYHPDANGHDPKQRKACEGLMRAINNARDRGDLKMMRQIADDPERFMAGGPVDLVDVTDLAALVRQYDEIVASTFCCIEQLNELRASPRFSMAIAFCNNPEVLNDITGRQIDALKGDIEVLKKREQQLNETMEAIS